ncbi:MAG: alpha/beta hydrolase, partial [Bifidobacteriaceae bacterium]|nr:alpha/beta hydrolase [Bifidobacteriaceae bacterium]
MTASHISRDLAYGPDPLHRLDLYRPHGAVRAAIVDIHGGGWWTGDKAHEVGLASALVRAGYLVAVPNYRLADGAARLNLYPTQVDDISSVLAWLYASDIDFDRAHVATVGSSSGGNLAAEVAIRHGLPAVAWSGLFDLDGFVTDHPDTVPRRLDVDPQAGPTEIDQTGANDQ